MVYTVRDTSADDKTASVTTTTPCSGTTCTSKPKTCKSCKPCKCDCDNADSTAEPPTEKNPDDHTASTSK